MQIKRVNKSRWSAKKIKSAKGKEGNFGTAYFETKDQAIKVIETLNKSKQYVAKQYKINDENGSREQKQ